MTSQRGVLPTTATGMLGGRYDASVMDSYAEMALARGQKRLAEAASFRSVGKYTVWLRNS